MTPDQRILCTSTAISPKKQECQGIQRTHEDEMVKRFRKAERACTNESATGVVLASKGLVVGSPGEWKIQRALGSQNARFLKEIKPTASQKYALRRGRAGQAQKVRPTPAFANDEGRLAV
jgi:hypothetical protein